MISILDNTSADRVISVANIQVPSPAVQPVPPALQKAARPVITRSAAENEIFFDGVRALLKSYGTIDKNVLATIFITECIEFGIDTRARIFGAARQTRCFKDGHVEAVLGKKTGADPSLHLCRRDEDGRYSLLQ